MRILVFSLLIMSLGQSAFAERSLEGRRSIIINSSYVARVVTLFKQISDLTAERGDPTASATECGYIFPGDGSKFGCKGSGKAAADVAAACSGGGELACTGSGSGRTCTCAFD